MTADPAAAAARLVARYRRQRPLRGGSLIVTIFGDAIMPRGGAVTLGSLISLAAPFGLNERLVRTAAARLAKEGWLEGRRAGKRSEYHLAPDGRERFAAATRRIYGAADTAWPGRWTVIVLLPMSPADRKRIREELIWQGFGELSSNVYAHPEIDSQSPRLERTAAGLRSKVVVFDATLAAGDVAQRLAGLGWDLEDLGMRYQRFVRRFERVETALQGGVAPHNPGTPDPQACFIVRTLLIHEYRRLHLRDPLLPPQLLPADWPGVRAAALCRDIYSRVFAPSEVHLSRWATQLDRPLPPPDASVLQRFGGIGLA